MPDRSLRLLTLPQQSVQGRSGVLLREQPASPPDAPAGKKNGDEGARPADGRGGPSPAEDDNPFAPPPEGTPDRPWQPRRPSGDSGGESGRGRSPWGSQWSDRQPGRSDGIFGQRPGSGGGGGQGSGPEGAGGGGQGSGLRWDPTDPSQRRARYALLCGMWAFFFVLFGWMSVGLMLGALALYWGISALRAKPHSADPNSPVPQGRPQTTAAVSGVVMASLAIMFVAAGFTAKLVYNDYYTCTSDALTNQAEQACTDLLPKELRGFLGTNG